MQKLVVRLNLLAVAGGAIGVFSLFLPWRSSTLFPDSATGFELPMYFQVLLAPIAFFLIGSLVSFFSPLGCGLQVAGFLSLGVISYYGNEQLFTWLALGPILAIISSILVLASIRFRVALEVLFKAKSTRGRLLTLAEQPDGDESAPETRGKKRFPFEGIRVTRANVFCLAGALIGLFSMTTAWITASWPYAPQEEIGSIILGAPRWPFIPADVALAGIVFLVGSIVALVTPLGGLAQLAGLAWFLSLVRDGLGTFSLNTVLGTYSIEVGLGVGFFLAMVSALLVLCPVLIHSQLKSTLHRAMSSNRFLTWSRSDPPSPANPTLGAPQGGVVLQTRVNVVAMVGVALGLISLFGTWLVGGNLRIPEASGATALCPAIIPTVFSSNLLMNILSSGDLFVQLGLVLCVVGVLFAAVTILGSAIIAAGVAMFAVGVRDLDLFNDPWYDTVFGPGFVFAAVSVAVLAASAIFPVWCTARLGSIRSLKRLLTLAVSLQPSHGDTEASRFPSFSIRYRSKWSTKARANSVCISGAFLGIVAGSLVWMSSSTDRWVYYDPNPAESVGTFMSASMFGYAPLDPMIWISLVFFVGCAVAILSPLGSLLQFSSEIAFIALFNQIASDYGFTDPAVDHGIGSGFILAVASSLLVGISAILPLGLRFGRRKLLTLLSWRVDEVAASVPRKTPLPASVSGQDSQGV